MGGLNRRKGIELEAHAGMAGTHDPVRDKLAVIAEMTAQAELGAGNRIFRRIQAGGEVGLMRAAGDMQPKPTGAAAMAGLAPNPIGELELPTTFVGGRVIGVAIEANARSMGVRQS